MKLRSVMFLLAATLASPAHAERLIFDHRMYPPLTSVLNDNRSEMLRYDDSNPKYITDRIATQGTSVDSWTEALDIIVRARGPKMRSVADWLSEIQMASRTLCTSEFTTLAQDAKSITVLRRSTGCPAGIAQTGLYRIVAGRRSLFLLNAFTIGDMPDTAKQQWLAMLNSAHIEP